MQWTEKLKRCSMVKARAILLDTHILLWWLVGDDRFHSELKDLVLRPEAKVVCSVATIWEMSIKESVGKLVYPQNIRAVLTRNNITILPVTVEHVEKLRQLPSIHRDPFDRILISQAIVEDMVLVTTDQQIQKYQVSHLAV